MCMNVNINAEIFFSWMFMFDHFPVHKRNSSPTFSFYSISLLPHSFFPTILLLSSQFPGTTCGHFWNELFRSLVNITNSCDRAGTIASELPITEQIPVSFYLFFSTALCTSSSFYISHSLSLFNILLLFIY